MRDGGIACARGFGATAPEGGEPVTPETTYRLASVTKPFTSVAVLQLAEEGMLDLDDPVGRHCPPFRDRERAPTVRQLLAHQGGLRHTTDREDTTITGDESLVRSVRRIAEEELAYPPGEATRYTLGWIVAAGPPGARGYLYGGSMEGSTALVYLVPDRCYALSILTNRERFVRQVAPLVRPLASATAPLESGSSACPLE